MSNQKPQSYANHAQFHPPFHFVFAPLSLIAFIAATINVIRSFSLASLVLWLLALLLLMLGLIARRNATVGQDRVIRMEENFRHFRLTGKELDPRISLAQIIALRFAGDEEFISLAAKAAESGMKPDEIKRAIKNWRADEYRV